MAKLILRISIAFVLLGVFATNSFSAVKTIRPDQFMIQETDKAVNQSPLFASSNSFTEHALFNAVVKLPAGKIIKTIMFYHQGTGVGIPDVTVETSILFYRTAADGTTDEIARLGSDQKTIGFIPITAETIHFPKIRRGYIYWFYIYSKNINSWIGNIQVTYK